MMGRRHFIAGACCALAPGGAAARGTAPTFLCATPDVETHESPSGAQTHDRHGRVIARVGASPDHALLWSRDHGATPGTGRITLDIAFLNGSARDHATVAHTAAEWTRGKLGRRIAFRFGRPVKGSHIRVKFRDGVGNLSDIGTQALLRGPHEPTVHFADVERRAILHEFGHVLGLHHEHQNPNSGIVWNRPYVLAQTAAFGWSAHKTEVNIFDRLSRDCTCIGDPKADFRSIMAYPFPEAWTLNGVSMAQNTSISARDRGCLEREYRA